MKYSVLLPTRKGGPFLANAIHSILDDPYADMELVVSDNANTDETSEILVSFSGDPRLKVTRTEEVIPVYDNWNRALNHSSGDYILMLGDDDYLLPGYFKKMDKLLVQYHYPNCITYKYNVFISPNSMANEVSYYSLDGFKFGNMYPLKGGALLPQARLSMLKDMFKFKSTFPWLMQPTLIARKAIDQIQGDMFQAPYPDFYALGSLLMVADSWVYHPETLIIVGVTSQSHGSYQYSSNHEREIKGLEYLGIEIDDDTQKQDHQSFNYWQIDQLILWIKKMSSNYPENLRGIEVDRSRCLLMLVLFWYLDYKVGTLSLRKLFGKVFSLSFADWMGMIYSGLLNAQTWKRLWRELRGRGNNPVQTVWAAAQPLDKEITDIKQFALWLGNRS